MPLFILTIKPVDNLSNKKLAFNINIIYLHKLKNHYVQLKSIEFENLNNRIDKKIISKYLHLLRCSINKYNRIFRILNSLHISGFVQYIKHYSVTSKKIKYNIIHISINPLIKKIVIVNSQKLQIPQNLLYQYLIKLLGLPRNYKKLNLAIEKIYFWYGIKGFNHTNIEIINVKNKHFLFLKIEEGIINKNSLECESKLNINKYYLKHIENRIIKELFIQPGNIINIKKIEIGIKKLKEARLISSCKYRIIHSDHKINIIVIYDIYQEGINNIQGKHVNINSYNGNQKINLSYYYYNNIKPFINFILSKPLVCTAKIKSLFCCTLYNIYIRKLERNLYFKYIHSYITHNQRKFFTFNIKLIKNYPICDLCISIPSIYTNNNLFGYFTIFSYKNLILAKLLYPVKQVVIENTYKLNQYISNVELQSRNAGIKFKHNLFDYVSLNEEINIVYNCINKNIINVERPYISYILSQSIGSQINLLKQIITQNILELDICIQYNDFNLTHIIEQGTSLIIKIKSLASLQLKKWYVINLSQSFNQDFRIKYHKILMLPKIIYSVRSYASAIIISATIHTPMNHVHHVNNSMKLNSIYNNHYIYKLLYSSPHILYIYDLEYHLFLQSHYSLYVFCRHTNQARTNINDVVYTSLHLYLSSQFNNYDINIGSGIQFSLPVRHIPPLRIEYCISNKSEKFLQLRVYSRYKEYS